MTEDAPRLFVGKHPLQTENMARNGTLLESLADKLLLVGGESVVVPFDNPAVVAAELPHLIRSGQVFDSVSAELERGEPSDCHVNAANLWRAGRGAICTGYALSAGMWRSHSWVRAPDGRVIETTELRDAYFGYELDDAGAAIFADLV